ncbi:hypothetical protein [Hyphomicrobium sp.]|uniref:hypothetical protein n=1 Tax=Hyphomicrobium sp. TaxID=82 RepID=UPI002D78D6B2|nr:hypothetical protein [Hyphomicrobium sp.]HET6388067.1 hypothetical protein [Hyphomicrobium sp.]
MRQTRSAILGSVDRARKIDRYRRRAWGHRRVALRTVDVQSRPQYIPGEYPEPPKWKSLALARRGVGLTSDVLLLSLFSPFFALWFLYRGALRLGRLATQPSKPVKPIKK